MHPISVLKKDRNEFSIYSLDWPDFQFSTVPLTEFDCVLISNRIKNRLQKSKKLVNHPQMIGQLLLSPVSS